MESRSIQFLAEAAGAELAGVDGNTMVQGIRTHSGMTQPGDLFVAIVGERVDGHDFVAEAMKRGAVAVVVAKDQAERFADVPRLVVEDPRRALGQMAARYRADFQLPVVAVAGSVGKTTTKNLIGSVLGSCFATLQSPESYNNDIGVPETLFALESRHLAAVVEVGTNHPGELAPLVRLAQPRIGVMTHLGEEHLEFFGNFAGVLEEEGWLADLLPPDGVLVLPGDPPWCGTVVKRTRARVIRVGAESANDWQILDVAPDAEGATFSMRAPMADWCGRYRVNLLGKHQVSNAALAVAVGAEFGLGREEIDRGLAACTPAKWRMNRWELDGVSVIEDCYNANLDSTLAALDTLHAFPCQGRRVCVLGPMAELGRHTARAHALVGRRAAELGIDRLVTVGEVASASAEAASDCGMSQVVVTDEVTTAAAGLQAYLKSGDCLLIKGSRSARLERLSALLRDHKHLQHAA